MKLFGRIFEPSRTLPLTQKNINVEENERAITVEFRQWCGLAVKLE